MKTQKNHDFFWRSAPANADIERHRRKEQELDAQIAALEGKTDAMSIAALRTLRHIRAQLLASKVAAVDKLGRGK